MLHSSVGKGIQIWKKHRKLRMKGLCVQKRNQIELCEKKLTRNCVPPENKNLQSFKRNSKKLLLSA